MAFPIVNGEFFRSVPRLTSSGGFTLMELLVSLAIVALLVSLAVPRYFGRYETAQETVLRENLHQIREALDKYYGDNGRYPDTLQDLVSRKYLRQIPPDPITGSSKTWKILAPEGGAKGRVFDIRSGAPGNGKDGTPYGSW